MVPLEALACCMDIVGADCPGGVCETLQDGAFGALVPVGDPEAMAQVILQTLEIPVDRGKQRGRARDFRLKVVVDLWIELLVLSS